MRGYAGVVTAAQAARASIGVGEKRMGAVAVLSVRKGWVLSLSCPARAQASPTLWLLAAAIVVIPGSDTSIYSLVYIAMHNKLPHA